MSSSSIVTPPDLREESSRQISPAEEEQTLNMSLLFATLANGRRTIALFSAAACVLGVLLALLLPVKYTATTTFLPPGSDLSGSSMASRLASLGGIGAGLLGAQKSSGDLYVGLLKSRAVTDRLIDKYDLRKVYGTKISSRAGKVLENNTNVTQGTKDSIISVSVTDKSPQRAEDLANGYVSALQDVTGGMSLTENSQRRSFYEQRLSQEKTALSDAEVALRKTQETTGIISPAGQTTSGIQQIAQLRAQVAAHQVELSALRQSETDDNPDVQRVRQELGSLQSQIAQMDKSQNGGPAGAPSNAQIPALELEYVRKVRDVKYHETLFDILAKQYEAARLDEAHDTPLQIIDRAPLPDVKSGPPRLLLTVGSTLLGCFAGCALVLLRPRMAASQG